MARFSFQGFSDAEIDYYSRQIVLNSIGLTGQRKLKNSRVCVVGVGGLGSSIVIQLASMGVGYLRIVDRDVVEASNLQRQHLYGMDMVGYPKVEAAAERIKRHNPFIEVDPVPMSVTPGNAEAVVEDMDVVVDGLDTMTPRYALNRACVKLGIPFVFGAVITNVGSTSTIVPGETPCVECFQGGIDDGELPTCAVAGVHPSIISIIASIQVSETVRLITGRRPNLAGALMYCDLEDLSFERIDLARVDSCPVCGSDPVSEPIPLKHDSFEEVCGREGRRVFVFSPDEDLGVDLEALNGKLMGLGFEPTVRARLGTSFVRGPVKGSVLSSGVTVIEGVDGPEVARGIRAKLLGL
ncbi:HesA/MoeB/ThiF family protein [Candidatus Bathyarchaeota archaeon]|nr:HesA/MoeB/ThiF family protein [Candidatus Bathyarchaeota archaeon]